MQRNLMRYRQSSGDRHDVALRRRGFTLIELMIVIAIIALLFSAIAVAAMYAIGGAKVAATRATIVKVQGLLQARIDSVLRKDPEKTLVDTLAVPTRFPNRKQAEVMARKFTFRQAFPQTWSEIATYYPNLLILSSETVPATVTAAAESSEVLLFLLTRANVLGYPPEGVDVFASAELGDTDSNGKMELIDAWGNPLRFYRWPTRLVRGGAWAAGGFTPSSTARAMMPSLPTTSQDLIHDSDDKYRFLKVLAPPAPQTPQNGVNGLLVAEATYFEQGGAMAGRFLNYGAFHTPETYTVPLVISAGPDGVTGLYEPSEGLSASPTMILNPAVSPWGYLAAPNPGLTNNTFDNVSNFNIRSGGK